MTTSTHRGRPDYRWRFAILACLLSLAPAAASRGAGAASPPPTPTPAPTSTPVPVIAMPPSPGLNQSPVAHFHFSRHFVHRGEKITGAITIESPVCLEVNCYEGTDWTRAGAPPKACPPRALTCSWTVTQPTGPQWVAARMPISSTLGTTESDDFYTVIDKRQHVLDGTVTDAAGNPFTNVALAISGPRGVHVPVDSNGYYSAILPGGRYTVAIDAGSARADQWFHPRASTITLTDRASANVTGYMQTVITATRPIVDATGLEAITLTVKEMNPFGQGVPGRLLRLTASGPAALICSNIPSHTGLIEPQDVVSGTPLYAPVNQPTDQTGMMTYQVFLGTQSGRLRFSAIDAAVAPTGLGAALSSARATVRITPGHWLTAIPSHWTVTVYEKGAGKRETLTLPRLIWEAVHGLTVRTPAPGLTFQAAGDPISTQKAMLRWVETYLPLTHLRIAPVSAAAGLSGGVLISASHGRDTRVLDSTTLTAIMNAPIPDTLPARLPTLSEWSARIGAPTFTDYAGWTGEKGLTYNGFPYLPVNPNLFSSFEASCLQKAP